MEDNYIKNKFSSLRYREEKPTPRIWEKLERNLKEKREKQFQKNFNIAVAASLVLVFTILLSQIIAFQPPKKDTAQETPIHSQDSTHKPTHPQKDTLILRQK